ncbi:GlsB/YeaQ/YmgE family stress response membrane protein [Aliiroseovarius sp. F20344]|uniref:GlsB/YeaQ/YmgE family stress response membrane protein n=1 Tax=Aliiroseovarius sp. F20344 TaxID=2926414 RepID=UPI001FF484D1|nr:GlsB/YeaQ/YmgE family stress response membrane protein [Aliiroseovarius sp. F20344]MCK0140946.1 GlsB/YeaQ/YmgE family stress response membrane protein [Aliiroseovarius sp. F20344]
MPFLLLIIVGAAAGFLATRIMDVRTDVPTTIAIGVGGALISGVLMRFLLAIGSFAFGAIGALLGAIFVIWLWQRFSGRS